MELRHTEKVILDKDDNSIGYTQMPIYDMIHLRIDGVDINRIDDGIHFRGKKITFPYEIPCGYEVYITYLTDDGRCGECLYMADLVKRFYNLLYGSDDNQYIDGYEEDMVKDHISDALVRIRNMKADQKTIRQYTFQIGEPIQNFECHDARCRTEYRQLDFIPKSGLAMTNSGVFINYQVVKGKLKFEKQTNIETKGAYFGYMLPNMGYIHSVKIDGKPVDYRLFNGYYFFPKVSGVVSIEYYNDIVVSDECCIEFDDKFARLPVYHAAYNMMSFRGDNRARLIKEQFDGLMGEYKLYLRRESAKDANARAKQVPKVKRYGYKKSLSGTRYVDTRYI